MPLFRLILTAAVALAPGAALAQSPLVGARIGIGRSGFAGSDRSGFAGPEWTSRANATGAVFARFPLHPRASLQVELAGARRGATTSGQRPPPSVEYVFTTVSLTYVEIPVTLHLRVDQGLNWPVHPTVFLGPAVALRVSCGYQSTQSSATGPRSNCRSPYEGQAVVPAILIPFTQAAPLDVGAVAGAALAVPLVNGTQGLAEVRYQRGLLEVDPGVPGFRNAGWSFSVGFMQKLGR